MEKPKILIYSDCYIYGGSERLMAFLLQNEGINKEFDLSFAFRTHKDYVKGLYGDLEKLQINIVPQPLFLLSNAVLFHKISCSQLPGILKKIIKIPFFLFQRLGIYFVYNLLVFIFFLKKQRPDAVHVNNGGYPGALTCNQFVLAAKFCGIKGIVYQVNNIALKTSNPVYTWFDGKINQYVKYFITASGRAGEALAADRKFDHKKIVQIPNTVFIEKNVRNRQQILEELKWPANSFLMVHVAFLTERKGQINLLKALRQIVQDHPAYRADLKLIFVGNGEDEHMLKKYATENNLDEMVLFAGYRPDSSDYINAADVFVLPSIANEDMPLSLLTAMNNGKPVLASRFAGIAEAVQDGRNGILIDPQPAHIVEKLQDAIIRLYTQPELRAELGKNAAITFREQYSQEIYAQKINSLYRQILS